MYLLLALLLAAARTAAPGPAPESDPASSGHWPLTPVPAVAADFAPPSSEYGAGHRGVDLSGTPGQVVHAALGGRVTFSGPLAGKPVVVVDHGSTRTTYEPVVAGVRVGQQVVAGQVIGTLQVTFGHCLPVACLHWGWIRNADDAYLDPLLLVGVGGPVRLVPWEGLTT